MQHGDGVRLDKEKIVAAFNKMDFGEAVQNTDLAKEWLQKHKINLEALESEFFTSSGSVKEFCDLVTKFRFFKEIVAELKKNIQLIAQLEVLVRGFTYKDAIKSITLFLDYLSFYSTQKSYKILPKQLNVIPENISLSYVGYHIGKNDCFRNDTTLIVDQKLAIILMAVKDIISKQCAQYQLDLDIAYSSNYTLPVLSGRTPVLVFNDADLDSACESIVNATYSDQGIMPWSVNIALVQENILDEVVAKLKHRMSQIKLGKSDDQQVDFSVPVLLGDYQAKLAETIAAASAKGIEVFQTGNTALFVGGKVFNNTVLQASEPRIPFLNVLAFRGMKEAAVLCNNQQQTFAASVWANDVGLVHELVHSLNVTTVWVNTHGVFHPKVPFCFDKFEESKFLASCDDLKEFYKKSSVMQPAWAKKSEQERINTLQNMAIELSSKLDKKNDLQLKALEQFLVMPAFSNVQVYGFHELKQFKEAVGVVFINKNGEFKANLEKAIIALSAGNGVILQLRGNDYATYNTLFKDVSAALSGLFQVAMSDTMYDYSTYHLGTELYYKHVWTAIGDNYV